MHYRVIKLRDVNRPGPPALVDVVNRHREAIKEQGHEIFGLFGALLGLATNEIYLVTFGETNLNLKLQKNIEVANDWTLKATARPTEHTAAQDPGVYVFRWFSVRPQTISEIVELSKNAWPDFESSFDTQVQGLFVEDIENPQIMLLLTWYRNLTVWEESRNPPNNARENFIRRHQLTLNALPIATSLLTSDTTRLVSHR